MGLVALLESQLAPNLTSPYIAAIALAALLAGRRCATLALVLSAVTIPLLYAETHGVAWLATGTGLARLVVFLLSAAAVALVCGGLHRQWKQAENQVRENLQLREQAERVAAQAREGTTRAEEQARRATAEAARAAQAVEALSRARNELEAVLQASPIAICSIDAAGRVRTWNRVAERMFGWAARDVVGQPLPIVSAAEAEEARVLRDRVLGGDAFGEHETRRLHHDGHEVPVLLSTAPLRDGQAGVVGLVAIYQDLTARKQLEAQFRQAQKMEAVGQLAAGVAHDFNNVLTVINSRCDLLQWGDGSPSSVEEVREIRAAADRAANLTRQLLAFSRQQVLQLRVFDLNEVVGGMEAMLQSLLGDPICVVTRFTRPLPNVRADAHQLEQVLLNLAVNARDAMPNGGSLVLETERVVLDESYRDTHLGGRRGPHVLLSVTDTGIGMDAATRARVFEPFFTTKDPGRGTGLGLSTAYGIVQQCGGCISVYSEPGQGTCFRIYLPEHEGPVERARPVPATSPKLPDRLTVLLVDDEPAVRRAVARLLERQGVTVLAASGSAEALERAVAYDGAIDLIISDVAMAGLDGIALIEQLRVLRPGAGTLLMSGYTAEAFSQLGRPSLAHRLLVKPFTTAGLLEAIHSVLREKCEPPTASGGRSVAR